MYEELVRTLRENTHKIDCEFCDRDCCWPDSDLHIGKCIVIQAADAIEELQKALADAHNELANKSEEKVGHWIEHEDDWWGNYWECSNCHDEYSIIEGDMYYKHCPGCGAKMEYIGDE